MAGTKAGGIKARQKVLEKYGEDFYKNIGKKGGENGHTGGFWGHPERARIAGQKGGKRSRRTGVKNGEGKKHVQNIQEA